MVLDSSIHLGVNSSINDEMVFGEEKMYIPKEERRDTFVRLTMTVLYMLHIEVDIHQRQL